MRNTQGFPPDPCFAHRASIPYRRMGFLVPNVTKPESHSPSILHNYAPQIKQMPLSYLKGIFEVRSGIEPL